MQPYELAAHEAIRQLVARYAHAADRGRFDDVVALFAPDGVLELPDGRTFRGAAAIRAFLAGTATSLRGEKPAAPLRHHVSSHAIELESETTASGWAYFLVVTPDGPDHWGRYADRYTKAEGPWRFAHRRVRVDGRAGRR